MSNVLLGTAIGDALGVPFETMLSNNPLLVSWDGIKFLGSMHHKLLPAQYSDDTQMSLMVAESLIENAGFNPDDLSQRYVEWIISGRARGYGTTTLMSVHNLLSGKHWSESGIAGSYGNGTAMRAAPFGVFFRKDLQSLITAVKIDSAITHASDEAEAGALSIALAAYYAINNDTENLLEKIWIHLPDSKVKVSIYGLESLINSDRITPQQALRVLGTKADVRETVPSSLYCFIKYDSYEKAIVAAIKSGNDTDTTAAIVGALFGALRGAQHIPLNWSNKIEDRDKLIQLDSQLYNKSSCKYF